MQNFARLFSGSVFRETPSVASRHQGDLFSFQIYFAARYTEHTGHLTHLSEEGLISLLNTHGIHNGILEYVCHEPHRVQQQIVRTLCLRLSPRSNWEFALPDGNWKLLKARELFRTSLYQSTEFSLFGWRAAPMQKSQRRLLREDYEATQESLTAAKLCPTYTGAKKH